MMEKHSGTGHGVVLARLGAHVLILIFGSAGAVAASQMGAASSAHKASCAADHCASEAAFNAVSDSAKPCAVGWERPDWSWGLD